MPLNGSHLSPYPINDGRGSIYRPDLGFTRSRSPSIIASFGLEGDAYAGRKVDSAKPAGLGGLQNGDIITASQRFRCSIWVISGMRCFAQEINPRFN
jgi:hypothetical protein